MPERRSVPPGEFLMVGCEGREVDDLLRRCILEWRVGGVILFDRNIRDPVQLFRLCSRMQELRRRVADSPLLIAVDQEGGTVARVSRGATVFPGNLALGVSSSPEDAYLQGRITGRELRELGINMNLAPVLDLYHPRSSSSLGLRSLGPDPERVAELGAALIGGMQEEAVIATAKHFPGKGLARRDSHQELPVIEASPAALRERDLLPFRRAAAAGVKAVMTSHAAYPALDGGLLRPGTLSPELLTGLLRGELGFRGVLISDDLGMGAIGKFCPIEEAVRKGLAAGVDIFLTCHSPRERESAWRELEKIAGEPGSEDRFRESGERVAALKAGLSVSPPLEPVGETGDRLAQRIARSAITSPVPPGRRPALDRRFLLVWFRPERMVEVESADGEDTGPGSFFRPAGFVPEVITLPLEPGGEDRAAVLKSLAGHSSVLITACDAYRFPGQRALIEEILTARPEAVLAVLRDPRDAELFSGAARLIVTRGYGPYALRALAEILAAGGGTGEN